MSEGIITERNNKRRLINDANAAFVDMRRQSRRKEAARALLTMYQLTESIQPEGWPGVAGMKLPDALQGRPVPTWAELDAVFQALDGLQDQRGMGLQEFAGSAIMDRYNERRTQLEALARG